MRKITTGLGALAVGLAGLLAMAGGGPVAGAAGIRASAPGVTANGILVGMITSTVGVAGPEFVHYADGARARFDAQNAVGGVNGRKISLITEDDGGSPTADLTVAQSLISKNIFAMIPGSPFFFEAYKYVQQQGLPVVGGGYDGAEWGQQPDTNMFSTAGNTGPNFLKNNLNTGAVNFLKAAGAKRVAALGYGVSPSSAQAAQAIEVMAPKVGLKAAYLNDTIPFGDVNVEPVVLAMKAANVDGVELDMDNNTNFAVLTAAKQSGLHFKAAISATGYGQTLLDDPSAVEAAQGAFFIQEGPPLNSSPEKIFRANVTKYAHFSGIPGFDWIQGYTQADLVIKGLEVAGKDPTRQSFIANLHKVTGYTAEGLLPAPIDLSLQGFGKPSGTACSWYAVLKGTHFESFPADGKPICGNRRPG
jgi:branched-chain amino acid transport system substrate-binding protein